MYFGEVQSAATGSGVVDSVQLSGSKFYTQHIGAWFWSSVNGTWGEGYVGPIVAITNELQIGIAAGFETTVVKPWRVGYIAGYYSGDHFAEVFGEFGEAHYWIRSDSNYQMNDWFGIGVHAETDFGVGPRVRLRLPASVNPIPIELWGAPAFDWTGNGAVGNRLNFIGGLRINL